ncbi:MAG TPA: sodium/proline symporter PutP [Candidatus Merdisoma faecalis]|uniref:sodium/proline symporter PutP n=1 Tax=Lachnoclostridium sp. An138 TaxID=1965560 RepID=UPI000B39FDD0|nr:sodium/proline symporter PutP [Lachnoclostridium sp. An138]OUQ18865.1 sodium/proline symporter [Lachnoclostridium sp. An138]HIR96323.1 sodium/proline symporter PutP [Candidatus Merdisoma faecalis]
MSGDTLKILLAMIGYMLVVIGIGLYFAKRAQANSENYFLGGRSLGPWVAAMSAEASDMSGWLLMGLPGVAYWCGLADAAWTAIGLALGTYVNWLIVAKRLRRYSAVAGDSITIPDFLSNRFHEKKKVILGISALFILVFFTVYAASCFVTCGKLFSTLFGTSYHSMMIAGAVFVLVYTFIGGFLAESASDFMQAVVMVIALLTILILGTNAAGGLGNVIENAAQIPGYLSLTAQATPVTDAAGVQQAAGGVPLFGEAGSYGFLTIISTLSWGLGYFGVPQVLLRFMAIRKEGELKQSRRIATIWCVISLAAAVIIGIIGRSLYPVEETLATASGAENVFVVLSQALLPAVLAGIIMAGILAATISSSDSYLLIAASAVSKNLYEGILKKNQADDKKVMNLSRIMLLLIAVVGMIIAWDEDSVIFNIVSFAWAGFGATFGPVMLFSLFWKRINRPGAIAGMLSGGVMVFVWNLLLKPMGGIFGIYELFPAFVISCIVIVVVSLATEAPSGEIEKEFELAAGKQALD